MDAAGAAHVMRLFPAADIASPHGLRRPPAALTPGVAPPRLFDTAPLGALRAVTHGAEEGKPPTLSATALAFYPTSLFMQLGVLATALLLAGIVVALMRRDGFVVVAFVAPFVLFVLLRNKDLRYTLPLLPLAAVLGGMAVAALGP